ncbi:MAG: pyridoxine 5'-phosphate synthase [bacterium]
MEPAHHIRLGVNIDHVATLRQARRTAYPSLVDAVAACERGGAEGITIHLREDRRHIQDADVRLLRTRIGTRLNLEMASHPDIVAIALEVRPDEVCLVPEKREELTTEGGLDVAGQRRELAPVCEALRARGIVVSLFIDPDLRQVEAAAELRAAYIELHTGTYCERSGAAAAVELERLRTAAQRAHELGIRVNAGHGLTLDNVAPVCALPWMDTLNIGHSIVCHAVFAGLENATRAMVQQISRAGTSAWEDGPTGR